MSSLNFSIDKKRKLGNLHIALSGEFNSMCAWELLKSVKRHNSAQGRVFVNTKGLARISPDGVALFKNHMPREKMPSDWLYFKGDKGFQIAPDGSRVLNCAKGRRAGKNGSGGASPIRRVIRRKTGQLK